MPGQRVIPRGPGHDTYEKGTPMITVAYQRADKTRLDLVAHNAHKGGKKSADMVGETIEPGSKVNAMNMRRTTPLRKKVTNMRRPTTARANMLPERTTKFIQTAASVRWDITQTGAKEAS